MNRLCKMVITMALPICLMAGAADAKILWTNPDNADNKLSLDGDVRFRYEMDHDGNAAAGKESDRTRERIRVRIGGVYDTGEGIEAGYQLATGASSLHSPHQNMGMNNGTTTTTTTTTTISGTTATSASSTTLAGNADFGTDKGYIKYKNSGFSIWAGKNSWGILQVSEAWLDSDINPEGINLGYKMDSLEVTVAQYIVNTASFNSQADAMIMYGLKYGVTPDFNLAVYGISTSEAKAGDLAGGATTYNILEAQGKITDMFTLGAEYMMSGMDDAHIGTGAKSGDKTGMTASVKAKISDAWGLQVGYYSIGAGSVLEKGSYAQDDFNYSSNFTGTKVQIDYKVVKDVAIDLRYYTQTILNGDITSSVGGAMKNGQKNSYDRIQMNINAKF